MMNEVAKRSGIILFGSRSPFPRRGLNGKSYGEIYLPHTDVSFVSSGRPSFDRVFPTLHDHLDIGRTPSRMSYSSEIDINQSYEFMQFGRRSVDVSCPPELQSVSVESDRLSNSSQSMVRTCSRFTDLAIFSSYVCCA